MVATTIPDVQEEEWARRFLGNFPEPWSGSQARADGGVLYALLYAFGDALTKQLVNAKWDLAACRIETAADEALDAIAKDYFGDVAGYPADVIRASGEPDESFRARIKATLLLPAATRQSLIDLLKRLTGEEPRIMEPWNPMDTAAWRSRSFFNVDSKANSSRFGNGGLRYQGFIESPLPSFANQGNFPIYCFDKGACWGAKQTYFFKSQATWWLQVARIDALINKTKPFGTTVWRKYTGQPLTRNTIGGTIYLEGGEPEIVVDVFPPFAGSFVVLADGNWNVRVSQQVLSSSQFKLVFSSPAPAGAIVDWVGSPITVGGVGRGGILADATDILIGVQPQNLNDVLIALPSWNTNAWLYSRSPSVADVRFSVPAPASANVAYQYFPSSLSGSVVASAGSPICSAPINTRDPFQAFALPTWNTTIEVDKNPSLLNFRFGTPPPIDAYVYWAIHES